MVTWAQWRERLVLGRRAALTRLRAARGGTDRRWERDDAYRPEWDERVRLMVRPVPPGATLVDLGAGQMAARRFLPADCTYVPIDMVARDPSTIVCDLNAQALPVLTADWVLMSGVLEYLADVDAALTWAHRTAPSLSLSFVIKESGISYARRLSLGWIQHLTRADLLGRLDRAGFEVTSEERLGPQVLVVAARRGGPDSQAGHRSVTGSCATLGR